MSQVDPPETKTVNVVTPPSSSSSSSPPQTIAVIGGGVSGLAAAWHLLTNTTHSVHVFESNAKLGGHAYTTSVAVERKSNDNNNEIEINNIDVDVGFMVFNDPNYPNMVRWFDELQIPTENSDMSLSVSLDGGRTLEWSSNGIMNGLLARRQQLVEPKFYQMMWDMKRFHDQAPLLLQLSLDDPRRQVTTGQYLKRHGYSEAFSMYYLLPMMAALWSASMADVMEFPAVQLISFLANHQMLNFTNRPQVCQ
jgi:predicted NAD/FAD-binding protein